MSTAPLYDLDIRDQQGVCYLQFSGSLDFETVGPLRERLKSEVSDQFDAIIVDLKAVEFLDSTGVGLFASLLKKAHSHNKEFAIVIQNGQPRSVFNLIGFDDLVTYYEDTQDALDALASQ